MESIPDVSTLPELSVIYCITFTYFFDKGNLSCVNLIIPVPVCMKYSRNVSQFECKIKLLQNKTFWVKVRLHLLKINLNHYIQFYIFCCQTVLTIDTRSYSLSLKKIWYSLKLSVAFFFRKISEVNF